MKLTDFIRSNLNAEQAAAALHTDTSSLIIAGAGSGKTRVLTYKIAYLIWWKKIAPLRILWVTFTNKAANEMKERLLQLGADIASKSRESENSADQTAINTPKEAHSDQILDFLNQIEIQETEQKNNNIHLTAPDLKWIGTFHSIFLKILKEDIQHLETAHTKEFWILDSDDSSKIIRELLRKFALNDTLKPQEVKGFISKLKNEGTKAADFAKYANGNYENMMGKLYQEYEKDLARSNMLDFDDLLLFPYELFKKKPEILTKWQKRFDYILVDEAQDTNTIQFDLIKMLSANGGNVTLIGDDFQSIYGWRGAQMQNFLNVNNHWKDIKMFKLQTNYRSKPHIVHAGNAVIKNNKYQYEKEVVAHREGNEKITIFSHLSEMDEAANTIEFLKQMKEKEKLKSWGQVAILYRTNAQSGPFESVLIQEGIPYKIRGAFKFFERREVKDILAYLRIIINPEDSISLRRVLNIPNRKVWKTSEERITERADLQGISFWAALNKIAHYNSNKSLEEYEKLKLTPQAYEGSKTFFHLIQELITASNSLVPAELINLILKKINYKDHLLKEEGSEQLAEEKYENLGQLINMASKYEFGKSNANQELISSGTDLLRRFLEEVTLMVDVIENDQAEQDAIKLMTIHSSKGLEFPMVFVVGTEDSVFPLANAMMEPELLEEERRLMYVAITRAKDVLFLSHAESRLTWGQTKMNPPSRFLKEIPEELVKFYDLGNSSNSREQSSISEGATVKHKLFGTGYVIEVWKDLGIIKFHNPKFWLRKVELRFLEEI